MATPQMSAAEINSAIIAKASNVFAAKLLVMTHMSYCQYLLYQAAIKGGHRDPLVVWYSPPI